MGRERYYLQRDEAQSRRDIRESEERAARSRGGINLSSGIGRGLGTLLGIALAPTTGGLSMALAGGLGSLGGSLAGRAYGKHKYGGPEKADVGLFNRDVAREQRKGVDQYWKGLKEQTAVNTLQDAITAGMYGAKIKTGMADAASSLGFDKTAIRLGYNPTAAMPVAPELLEANTAGVFPDAPTRLPLEGMERSKWRKVLDNTVGDASADLSKAAVVGGTAATTGTGTITSAGYAGDKGAGFGKGVAGGGGGGGAGQGMNNWIENLGKKQDYLGDAISNTGLVGNTRPAPLLPQAAGYTGSAAQNMQLIDQYNQFTPVQYSSVVDMLKAQGQESSFDARTNLWNQLAQMGVR